MKVVFAGPSIYGLDVAQYGVEVRPPAVQGDVARAVEDGATIIGLIDGHFEQVASVWHKEILHALSEGVTVLGAASMGALRAAECAAFGMLPIGVIAHRYLSGELDDDAAVALVNGPAELGYLPLSEAMVDAEATVHNMLALQLISADEATALLSSARRLFFKQRTAQTIVTNGKLCGRDREREVLDHYRHYRISLKAGDAAALLVAMQALPPARRAERPSWVFGSSPFWRQQLEKTRAAP